MKTLILILFVLITGYLSSLTGQFINNTTNNIDEYFSNVECTTDIDCYQKTGINY